MELIEQEHNTSCGIACVAMLTDRKYHYVKNLAEKNECHFQTPKNTLYTSSAHLIRLFNLSKKTKKISITSSRRKKFKSVEELPDRAILSLPIAKEPKKWHWVVFERSGGGKVCLYDPKFKGSKKYVGIGNIEKMKITHFLEVK